MAVSTSTHLGTDRCGVAMEELNRGEEYAHQLRALLFQRVRLEDSWSENAAKLVDEILCAIAVARAVLELQDCATIESDFSQHQAHKITGPTIIQAHSNIKTAGSKKRSKMSLGTWMTSQPYYDGYEWRKYGQKKISGSFFQREYFRCAFKEQGCLATKQVQKESNGETPVYLVTRNVQHTCTPTHASLPGMDLEFIYENLGIPNVDPSRLIKKEEVEEPLAYMEPPKKSPKRERSVSYCPDVRQQQFQRSSSCVPPDWTQKNGLGSPSSPLMSNDIFSFEACAEFESIFESLIPIFDEGIL